MQQEVDEEDGPEAAILTSKRVSLSESAVSSKLTTGHTDPNEKWLLALNDPLSSLYTLSSCICFADIYNEGDVKLVIADLGNGIQNIKLNVYKGIVMQTQVALVDLPSAVLCFHMDSDSGPIPALAVAAGNFLFVYKNLKPFYKFQLPPLGLNETEVDAWNQIKDQKTDVETFREMLHSLKRQVGSVPLTARSCQFLALTDRNEMERFVEQHRDQPLRRQTIITCATTVKRSVSEEDGASCLVIGTENKDVLFIEPDAFTILLSVALPAVPVLMDISGLFAVEFKLLVSCRQSCIYSVKRGFKTGKLVKQLMSQPVGLVQVNSNIITACMDRSYSCFSSKGHVMWSLTLEADITTIAPIEVQMQSDKLVAVALTNKKVLIFHDKYKVDTIETDEVVNCMRYGKYGRESGTLVTVSRNGSLSIRILKRTVKFYPRDAPGVGNSIAAAANKLLLPKKTKLFVDHTMRERNECAAIHQTLQQDMYRLKLMAARSYVKAISCSMNPVSVNPSANSLSLTAQVHGLGPIFRLVLEIRNNNSDKAVTGMFFTFYCDDQVYDIETNHIPVPYLTPGITYMSEVRVRCVSPLNVADSIRVFVVRESDPVPVLTAVINMPACEAEI